MRNWIGGIISALSGGVVTGASTMVVAPESFNFAEGFTNVLIVAAFSGAVAVLNYLAKSPLPEKKD